MSVKAAFAVIALSLASTAPALAVEVVRVGLAPTVSSSMDSIRRVVSALQLSSERTGIEIVAVETGGSVDNLRRLDRGQIDVAIVSRHSLLTIEDRDGNSLSDKLRVLCAYSVSPQDLYVRSAIGVGSLADLEGKPLIAGGAGTGTERTTVAVFATLGIKPKWVRVAMDQIQGAIREEEAVGFVKSGEITRPDSLTLRIQRETADMTAVPLEPAQLELLKSRLPGIIGWPAGDRKGPGMTWADPTLIVSTSRLGNAAAKLITSALLADDDQSDGYDRRSATFELRGMVHPGSLDALTAP